MAIFTIPEEYEIGLARLLTLNDESVQELLTALESISPSLRFRSVADRVAPKVTSIPKEDVEDIIEVLFALNTIRTGAEVPTAFFVEDICDAVSESESELLTAAAGLCESFRPQLVKLLECNTLAIASKSALLLRESGRTYCSARVLSDLRPVFGESVESAPIAAVVVHTLKITYHQGEQLKDIFVALNTRDVQKLRELLDRADAKAKSLRAFLSASNTSYVDAE